MMTREEFENNTNWKMSYEEYMKCYCPECCKKENCIHRDAYRRVPKIDGGLGLWFNRWMEIYKERSIRPNTKREYTHIYQKNISPYMGERLITSIVKSDIQKLIDEAHDNGYKYERQNKIKVILRDMLERALEDNLLVNNPVSGIKLRADKEITAKALTREEQDIFFSYCKNTFYDNLFNVAVNTGLRPGELFALTVKDINFEQGYIDVNKTLVYQKYLDDECKTFHIELQKNKIQL